MERKMASLRGRVIRPRSMLQENRDAYKFHEKCNVLPLWEKHSRQVLIKAQETTIVEQNIIEGPESDIYRAWVNSVIASIINYHLLDYKALSRDNPVFPSALRDERVLQELEVFGKLTDLDRKGADLSEYIPLLNNGDAPLALLAKIADYAITHNQHDMLRDFVSTIPHPLFRLYPSLKNAQESMASDAKAGMQIYAPLAELFGHPGLAGDIFKHSFHILYPDVYNFVLDQLKDERTQEKVYFTQKLVKGIIKKIEQRLIAEGFTCDVTPRWRKHEGKIMKKVRSELSNEYTESEESNTISLKEYISRRFESYSITELHDIIASRVIIDKYNGEDVDKMSDEQKTEAINKAKKVIEDNIKMLIESSKHSYEYDHKFNDKENGYRSHHFDVKPLSVISATNFEMQLRTREWHEISEHGKAAHFYYIGGDSEFVKLIQDAYERRIHMFRRAA